MKQIIGLICLSLVCLGIAWIEFQMVSHFRSALILIALPAVLGAMSIALFVRRKVTSGLMAFMFACVTGDLLATPDFSNSGCGENVREFPSDVQV
jgi:hypothetical protein